MIFDLDHFCSIHMSLQFGSRSITPDNKSDQIHKVLLLAWSRFKGNMSESLVHN